MLPDGPILLTADNIWKAVKTEVWDKSPYKFKIQILEQVKNLFPSNPLFAGFGNAILTLDLMLTQELGSRETEFI